MFNSFYLIFLYSISSFDEVKPSSSSSSCPAISRDIPDPLSPLLPIVHCFQQVFMAKFHIQELLYIGSSWSSCLCSAILRGPLVYITYKLVPTSSAVSRMSGSSNFDSFRHGWYYLPTPPLGQDMTQGQFFKRSLTGLNSEFSFS